MYTKLKPVRWGLPKEAGAAMGGVSKILKKPGQIASREFYRVFRYLLLICVSFAILQPLLFVFMRSLSLTKDFTIKSFVWIPPSFTFEHYRGLFVHNNIFGMMRLSAIVALGATILQCATCSLTGYGLARYRFFGSKAIFGLALLTYVVPIQMASIPMFMDFFRFDFFGFGWIGALFNEGTPWSINLLGTPWVFYLPAVFGLGINGGLFIYLFYQFFKNMPSELDDAAKVDGCGRLMVFLRIYVPNSLPVFVTVFLLSCVYYRNDSTIATMFLSTQGNTTLMAFLNSTWTFLYDHERSGQVILLWSSALFFAVLPPTAVFIAAQRFFIECIDRSGIKG